MVPSDGGLHLVGPAVVAWNGSREASRAVACALPLLAEVGQVVVFTEADAKATERSGAELVEYLAWHGIPAVVRSRQAADESTGHALLETVRSAGAGLLVMGAYTRSRLRQLVLGGVTREVIAHAHVPVLMAH